nr:unnamed protein product [Callosobruchus analis]
MSHTPDTSSFQKFSPFGARINKSLLTPCRRVGLSRKRGSRSTPISITKTPTEGSNESLLNEDSSKTPVNHEHSISRRKHSHSLSRDVKLEKRKILDNTPIKNSTCKKVLAQNFSLEKSDQASRPTDQIEDFGALNTSVNTIQLQNYKEKEQDNLPARDKNQDTQEKPQNSQKDPKEFVAEPMIKTCFETTQDVNKTENEETSHNLEGSNSNTKIKKKEKLDKSNRSHKTTEKLSIRKAVISSAEYDSDDDFIPLDTKLLEKRKSSLVDNTLNSKSSLKACSIKLKRLDSEQSLKSRSFITSDDEGDDDCSFDNIKKKKCFIIDDSDSIDSSPQHLVANSLSNLVSNLHEDEDMAFTSTPEQRRIKKRN